MKFRIYDWAGNDIFDGENFSSFSDAEEYLTEFLTESNKDYDTERGEYEISEV